jgi:hypothetical protein
MQIYESTLAFAIKPSVAGLDELDFASVDAHV